MIMQTGRFIDYLNENGIYCYNNIIEEFLLSFKINNKILVTGASLIDKRTFLITFIKYYFERNDLNNRIKSNFTVGKTITSKGFAVKRKDVYDILPKISYEDKCNFIVDGIKVNARLNLTPRLFFRPTDNKDFYDYLNQVTQQNIDVLDYELVLNDSNSLNYKSFNASVKLNSQDVMDYIQEAKDNNYSHYFIIFNNITDDNIHEFILDDEIPDNLTIFYVGNVKDFTSIIDELSVINFDPVSPMDYLQNNLANVNFKNVEYLENPQKEYLGNINDIKKLLQNIYVSENKSLYNVLVDELNRLYHILANEDIYLSTTCVDNILKYMIISWKYEDCPDVFVNWYKYYDFQIIQRVIPLFNDKLSVETFESLVDYCNGEFNYYRSYSRINGML